LHSALAYRAPEAYEASKPSTRGSSSVWLVFVSHTGGAVQQDHQPDWQAFERPAAAILSPKDPFPWLVEWIGSRLSRHLVQHGGACFDGWSAYLDVMIDVASISAHFEALEPVLGERGRRLFASSDARAAGHGGVVAVSGATEIARSTIDRGLADLRSGAAMFSPRVRRQGGGKPATETQPGLLESLNDLVQSAIHGDPEAALVWVSKSLRHLSAVLADLGFSLQCNAKTREGTVIATVTHSSSKSMPK
jgi:hypothetical protein